MELLKNIILQRIDAYNLTDEQKESLKNYIS